MDFFALRMILRKNPDGTDAENLFYNPLRKRFDEHCECGEGAPMPPEFFFLADELEEHKTAFLEEVCTRYDHFPAYPEHRPCITHIRPTDPDWQGIYDHHFKPF